MAKRKLTKAEQISQIPWSEISKIKGDEAGYKQLRGYLKTLRSGYSRRVAAFNRKNLFSYAKHAYEKTIPDGYKAPQINKLNRNQLLLEIARYVKFFNDETSSEQGIKRINREQDARIFGTDSFGRPLQHMSTEERMDYWALYEEFEKAFPIWATQSYSDTTQQLIASAFFEDENFARMSMADRLSYLNKIIQEKLSIINLEDTPNAYAGRGPTAP